jgi:hypothetical protein
MLTSAEDFGGGGCAAAFHWSARSITPIRSADVEEQRT